MSSKQTNNNSKKKNTVKKGSNNANVKNNNNTVKKVNNNSKNTNNKTTTTKKPVKNNQSNKPKKVVVEEPITKKADNRFITTESIKEEIKEIQKKIQKEDIKEEKIVKKNKKISIILIILLLLIVLLIAVAISFLIYLNNAEHFKDVTLELGNKNVTLKDFVKNQKKLEDCELITDLSTINFDKVGTYNIQLSYLGVIDNAKLIIKDTTAPEVTLEGKTIYNDEKVEVNDFVKETYDISGDVTCELVTEIDYTKEGDVEVEIKCHDQNGNEKIEKTTLTIQKDKEGPVFSGLTNLTVKKNAKINYTSGVSAKDAKDGKVEFTYDASSVNTSTSGSYYVTYTATDKSGNKTTKKRKITVDHDDEDTKAMVQKIADSLSSDPEVLRDYCRNNIRYDHNNGGDDPLYYGLTNKKGNCYVHAQCFKALLDAKGIENQLIWVTNKTHYWNLVKINGVWRHMDSTPDRNHRKISIMTDEQRLSTLSGRKWDFSAWPAAN